MPDEYLVSYTTKLDLLNNNFGSSTAIVTSEDDGIFSRSYTSEQINNWANELAGARKQDLHAGVPRHRGVCGRPHIRNARSAHRGGDRNPDQGRCLRCRQGVAFRHAISSVTEIEKTVENANLYAWYGELSIGELQIPVELEGQTYYIVPSDGNGALRDGELVDVKMTETPFRGISRTPATTAC